MRWQRKIKTFCCFYRREDRKDRENNDRQKDRKTKVLDRKTKNLNFITFLVGWSVINDSQLVISLFQQLMVTQFRMMEWYPSLTARQTINVFAWLILPCHLQVIKRKENHGHAYAPQGAMGLKLWGSLASKLAAYPIALDPHLWCQACPWRKSLTRKIAPWA